MKAGLGWVSQGLERHGRLGMVRRVKAMHGEAGWARLGSQVGERRGLAGWARLGKVMLGSAGMARLGLVRQACRG